MPNSHEGHRDTYKSLTLEGAPSKADRRQEVLFPWGGGGSREGIWRLQEASRHHEQMSVLTGRGLQGWRTQNKSRYRAPEALPVQETVVLVRGKGIGSSQRLNNQERTASFRDSQTHTRSSISIKNRVGLCDHREGKRSSQVLRLHMLLWRGSH